MELVDTKHADVVIEGGVVKLKIAAGPVVGQIELPIIQILKELAKKSDNSLDDALVELVEKALG